MRTIYWKRYGVIVPLLVLTGLISAIIIVIQVSLQAIRRPAKDHPHHQPHGHQTEEDNSLSDNDFADLVRRPDLGEFDDDDGFDGALVTDPEDTGVYGIITDPDEIPDGERLRSGVVVAENKYTTEAPSDLMEDDEGHGFATDEPPTDGRRKSHRKNARKIQPATNLSPFDALGEAIDMPASEDLVGAQDLVGTQGMVGAQDLVGTQGMVGAQDLVGTQGMVGAQDLVGTQGMVGAQDLEGTQGMVETQDLVGAQDYHAGTGAIDFQDGPLTPDEEYALHLDDQEIVHARAGMHSLETSDNAYSQEQQSAATGQHVDSGAYSGSSDTQPAPAPAYHAGGYVQQAASVGFSAGGTLIHEQAPRMFDAEVPDYTMDDDDYTVEAKAEVVKHPYIPPEKPMNVLFIIMDDLRPQLGNYEGRDYGALNDTHKMYTPHIDALASKSLVLKRAYAQYSMCGPSRASLMTSRRPDVTKAYQNYVYWRYWSVGNFSTIPQYFKDHGYSTLGAGKIFHVDLLPKDYDPPSWSHPYFRPRPSAYDRDTSVNWRAVPQNATEPLVDQNTADYAVQKLAQLSIGAQNGNPFFFAVGFNQPHFRHVCPAEFFEHYRLEKKKFMFKESWQTPPYLPRSNLAPLVEGMNNTDLTHIPSVPMREIRRAYFACVSYVDSLVGKLMKGLKDNGLEDSTVVTLVSDHGYHMGDNDMFGTYSNHEMALHVPLMIKIPGRTVRGIESRSLVELVDVFPTLVQAVGLPAIPKCPERSSEIQVCTDGVSLLPLLRRPKMYIKDAVFAQLQRGRSLTEYTIRTNKYRLIDLATHRRTMLYPGVYQHQLDFDLDLRGRRHGRRLYDLTKDPLEAVNCADDPFYADTIARLRAKLRHTFVNVYDYSKFLFHSFPE